MNAHEFTCRLVYFNDDEATAVFDGSQLDGLT